MLLTAFSANAQQRQRDALTYGGGGNGGPDPNGWGLSLGVGYDGTTGDMRSTYSGAPAYSLSILKNWNGFTFNGTIGYVSYKPKQDTVTIDVDGTEVGYIKYDNFNSLEFFVGGAYNIPAADIVNIYIGANVGAYANKFKYEVATLEGNASASTSGTSEFVSPKIGLNFIIDNHFTFSIEGRYNLEFGKYNPSSGQDVAVATSAGSQSIKTYTVSGVLSYFF